MDIDYIIFWKKRSSCFHSKLGFDKIWVSTTHAHIRLTSKIRNEIDRGNCAFGIFVDFLKAFDIVDHILEHFGTR